MLRACKRLLRPGGRIAYYTIHVAPGLPEPEHRRAIYAGPRAVASRADQDQLLRSAGFVDVEQVDATGEFRETQWAWHAQYAARFDEAAAVIGAEELRIRQRERRLSGAAVEAGILRRSLLVGTRPVSAITPRRRPTR